MGNFYSNITTLGPGQADLAAVLARYRRRSFVTPTRDKITVVFDQVSDAQGDPRELGDLALTLSSELSCPALAALVHDDDILLLALYDKGQQLGEYNSAGASTLRAVTLARVFRASWLVVFVWLLLKSPRLPFFLFETLRHRLLLAVLGQPAWACGTGYKYIQQNEPPPGLAEGALIFVDGFEPKVDE